jgi:hypothetical protein
MEDDTVYGRQDLLLDAKRGCGYIAIVAAAVDVVGRLKGQDIPVADVLFGASVVAYGMLRNRLQPHDETARED